MHLHHPRTARKSAAFLEETISEPSTCLHPPCVTKSRARLREETHLAALQLPTAWYPEGCAPLSRSHSGAVLSGEGRGNGQGEGRGWGLGVALLGLCRSLSP
ncbi:uncharacterized protein LOC121107130 isoform X1 [Gallus gallus]|nr:uncharacterized protein LOC121107130 isoform X1 [Gallus gallus]